MPVQVARQAAAREALLCAEQLAALQGRAVTITLPSATTARDLSPSRPTLRTTRRNVARNNLYAACTTQSYFIKYTLASSLGALGHGRVSLG